MDVKLKIFLVLIVLFQLFLIIKTIKKNNLSIRYGVLWLFLIFLMFLAIIFSDFVGVISSFLGFEVTSNMVLILLAFFQFFMSFYLTLKISKQSFQIKTLIQEVSILKESESHYEWKK